MICSLSTDDRSSWQEVPIDRLRVLVTVPQPLRGHIMQPATLARLSSLATVTFNEDGRNWSAGELAERLPGVDVILASWGLPPLTDEVLARADRLRLVAYGAGSVKGFATPALFDRGIAVCHAAPRIADSVAEFTVMVALMGLRRPQDFDRRMKAGEGWPKAVDAPLYEIANKRVGLLGMGYVGQRTARLFRALGADVWCYDPYLAAEDAAALGVRSAALDDLLRGCQVISVHLPVTEETRHLLGRRELSLIADGSVFVNCARAWAVDQDALLAELSTGRFWAALDVFDVEPLSADSPWRRLDSVLLTPHVAGLTRDCYYGLSELMIDEIARFVAGEPLHHRVTREALAHMA
jgi:phosphoglycerate dehydrogenase-like enzyme